MRKLIALFLLLTVCLICCKRPPAVKPGNGKPGTDTTVAVTIKPIDPSIVNDYNISLTKWQSFKNSAGNGYVFVIAIAYVDMPYSNTETKITVVNNVVVKRDYLAYKSTASGKVTIDQWNEDKNQINSHPNVTWLLTMDDVYTKAQTEWLNVDPAKNTIYYETKNNGLISQAGYFPNGCQDNCFLGVNITIIISL